LYAAARGAHAFKNIIFLLLRNALSYEQVQIVMSFNPIYVAVDTPDLQKACTLARALVGKVGGLKLGLEFFNAFGPAGVAQVSQAAAQGDGVAMPVFLDMKYHDIPNTVAGAVRAACALKPAILNVHAVGGRTMMEAAVRAADAAAAEYGHRPLMIAVTVLTSMDGTDLAQTGISAAVQDQVQRLAALAQESGMDGVVCSPQEAAVLRAALGADFKLITPGVRPSWAATNDQKRIMTPQDAVAAGADYLVIGRPITAAADPADAATQICAELGL
jgi:orotidine-5'-phosphate decarboxylase